MKREIAKEYPPEKENFYIHQMLDELKKQMDHLFPNGTRMLRQAETKMHGCLKAQFIVNPYLEEKLKIGIFANSNTYDAIVRFSNAKTGIVSDYAKDERGIAVKLIGVKGEKLMVEEHLAETQDFIALSSETFVSKNVKEFSGIIKAFTAGKLNLLLFVLNPMHWSLLFRVKKAATRIGSLLEQNYWSTTPYQFGDHAAIKFQFRSTLNKDTIIPPTPDPDYLKNQMVQFFKGSDLTFDFMIQFQENAETMPIEDPTIKWNSEFYKLATLYIPKQEFDIDKNRQYGEALSFNPWHSLSLHRPLGGLNRARLAIYSQLAEYRNKVNGLPVFEPQDMSFQLPVK
ncbi:MAG: catalase family protein [Saprospiraceae bacterium]